MLSGLISAFLAEAALDGHSDTHSSPFLCMGHSDGGEGEEAEEGGLGDGDDEDCWLPIFDVASRTDSTVPNFDKVKNYKDKVDYITLFVQTMM